jgi:ketosteroid isomerase-like protein
MFDQVAVELKSIVDDLKLSGDLAFYHGTWTQKNTPKDGGEPRKLNGNAIVILQKQADGAWKIIYHGWSNEKMIKPWEVE